MNLENLNFKNGLQIQPTTLNDKMRKFFYLGSKLKTAYDKFA